MRALLISYGFQTTVIRHSDDIVFSHFSTQALGSTLNSP
jgi:hypothetical protein